MPKDFTFINTTDAPNLGASQSKVMRAHVTKNNFMQRRRRLAKQRKQDGCTEGRRTSLKSPSASPTVAARQTSQIISNRVVSLTGLLPSPKYPDQAIKFLLHEYRPLVFPDGTGGPGSARESTWMNLISSEPALVEASMSIALRHGSGRPQSYRTSEAYWHETQAMGMINSRLNHPAAGITDGVLAAVFLLTFGMRLSNDEAAMDIHLEGLTRMITYRRVQGVHSIPSWFSNILLYDSIHQTIASTGVRHEKVIRALRDDNVRRIIDIRNISRGVSKFCQTLQVFHSHPARPSFIENEIEASLAQLHLETRALFRDDVPYVRALVRAIDLFLSLSWPSKANADYADQALSLKANLLEPQITLCGSHDLTVWQFFIGGVAAESDVKARDWFIMRLKEMLFSMRVTSWKDVFAILTKAYLPDASLLTRFMQVWREAQGTKLDS